MIMDITFSPGDMIMCTQKKTWFLIKWSETCKYLRTYVQSNRCVTLFRKLFVGNFILTGESYVPQNETHVFRKCLTENRHTSNINEYEPKTNDIKNTTCSLFLVCVNQISDVNTFYLWKLFFFFQQIFSKFNCAI